MPAKKPAKPTRLQVKADKKNKVLTGPTGSKPQSTTTNRVRTQGGTTMSKPKPAPSAGRRVNPKAAKPKPAPKPAAPKAGPKPYQVSDPWAGPKRASIGNVKPGPATNPKAAKPKPAPKPATQSTRQANARAKLRDASRGSTGPNRVGQPAGSANRMFGANVVNNSVNRAIRDTRLAGLGKAVGKVALPAAIATQVMDVVGGFQKLANHPFLKGKDGKPTPSAGKPATDGRYIPGSQQVAIPKPKPKPAAPPAPKLPAPTRTTVARPAAKPKPTPKPKAPAKAKPPAASKPTVAQTSGIGPVKSGAAYASKKGSISESVRQLREIKAASTRRQTGQAAPALSSSKDYSSQFKDMKGGSSRFAAELKKKKKAK
jgi:hypothetical protein